MKTISAPKCTTKEEAAQLLGLKTYDTAIPQTWIDEVLVKIRKKHQDEPEYLPDDLYHIILGGVVWCYDGGSVFGYPVILTDKAYSFIKEIITGYEEYFNKQEIILHISTKE